MTTPTHPRPPGARSQGRNFAAAVLGIVLPVVLLTGVSHYLLLDTVDRFQGAMDRTVGLLVPVVSLHSELLGALIPPHDYLIHGDPAERQAMADAAHRVDVLMDDLQEVASLSPEDRQVLAEARADWAKAREAALAIVRQPPRVPEGEAALENERLDLQMDRTVAHIDTLFDDSLRDLGQEWGGIRRHTRHQLLATTLLSMLVVGLAVAAGVAVVRMGGALKVSEARFAHMARHDPLTGLENRQEFHRRLEEELERARRFSRPCSLVMLDVDHFKAVNDTHGHPAGDEALRRVAAVLKRQVRQIDRVARYGGEEFVLLLPETDAEGAAELAERVRVQVAAHPVPLAEGLEERLTASLGVAAYPADGTAPADLVRAADQALYAAKRGGRDQVARAARIPV